MPVETTGRVTRSGQAGKAVDAPYAKPAKKAAKEPKAAPKPKAASKPKPKVPVAAQEPEDEDQEEPEVVAEETEQAEQPKVKEGELFEGKLLTTELEVCTSQGETIKLSSIWSQQPVLIFFYPKASTPGCTTQACGFRDNHELFAKKGYAIYGLSADSAKAQSNWKTKEK